MQNSNRVGIGTFYDLRKPGSKSRDWLKKPGALNHRIPIKSVDFGIAYIVRLLSPWLTFPFVEKAILQNSFFSNMRPEMSFDNLILQRKKCFTFPSLIHKKQRPFKR